MIEMRELGRAGIDVYSICFGDAVDVVAPFRFHPPSAVGPFMDEAAAPRNYDRAPPVAPRYPNQSNAARHDRLSPRVPEARCGEIQASFARWPS